MALSSRDRRALAVLLTVGVAAAAFGGYFFFLRGEPAPDQPSLASPAPVTSPETDEGKEPAKKAKKSPPKFAFFGGRDPFVPLVVAAPGGGGTGTSGVSPVTGGGSAVDRTEIGGHSVALIDISGDVVQVTVDGQTYSVTPGEEFDGNFELVSVSGGCANFLFGDEAFTLCEPGERK